MKHVFRIVMLCLLVWACSSDPDPVMSDTDRARVAIDANSVLVSGSLDRTSGGIAAGGGVDAFKEKSKTPASFFLTIQPIAHKAFQDEYNAVSAGLGLKAKTFSTKSRTFSAFEKIIAQPALTPAGTDYAVYLVSLFEESVSDTLAKHPTQIEVESFSWNVSTAASTPAVSSMSVAELIAFKQEVGPLILAGANTDEVQRVFNEYAAEKPKQAVLIALLLPAVQKAGFEEPAINSFINQVFPNGTSGQKAALERTMRYAAFLSAIDHLVSDEFDGTNELTASVGVNRAICHGVTALAWARI